MAFSESEDLEDLPSPSTAYYQESLWNGSNSCRLTRIFVAVALFIWFLLILNILQLDSTNGDNSSAYHNDFFELAEPVNSSTIPLKFRGTILEDSFPPLAYSKPINDYDKRRISKALVIARNNEDCSWIDVYLGDNVPHYVYQVNDPLAVNQVPKNSGNEAMVYLTYIIDHYESLPDFVMFMHAHRHAWHSWRGHPAEWFAKNVKWGKFHFANLRCDDVTLGHLVPAIPDLAPEPLLVEESRRYTAGFKLAFGDELGPVPMIVDAPQASQFIVSREAIMIRSREFYERTRKWLLETDWPSAHSGRIFEHSWHILFGSNASPRFGNVRNCGCELFGVCS